MYRYVALINWTTQGVRNARDTVDRCERFTRRVESTGGTVRELLWTVGEYDLAAVIEFPDEETAAAVILKAGEQGDVRTTTMRAFTSDEMVAILKRAGQIA